MNFHTLLDKLFKEEMNSIKIEQVTDQRGSNKGVKRSNVIGSKNGSIEIILNLFKGHYFIEERTKVTNSFVIHKYLYREDIDESFMNKIYTKNGWRIDNSSKNFLMSGKLVKSLWCIDQVYDKLKSMLIKQTDNEFVYEGNITSPPIDFEQRCFKQLTYGDASILRTVFYNKVDEIDYDLNYNKEFCTKLIKPTPNWQEKSKTKKTYWFADYEADSTGEVHKPYMCCLSSLTGRVKKTFKGEDCATQFLDFLPDNSCVYFHNLSYDIRMMAHLGICKSLMKGNKVLNASIKHNGKVIHFKDSCCVLNCKLLEMSEMFHLDVHKEIFPYDHYTMERLKNGVGIINECKVILGEEFEKNIDELNARCDENGNPDPNGSCFDMWKYAEFYCMQDVEVLRKGFCCFRNGFLKEFGIDIFNYVTISSIADAVIKQNVFYKNGNLYELGGVVRKFCANAIHGGRCMTAFNKKWHIFERVLDIDAVSLYASAMKRLYVVEGIPHVLTEFDAEQIHNSIPNWLSEKTAYVIDIEIGNVHKHYAFPLIGIKTDDGIFYNDHLDKPTRLTVCDIQLEDLVKYQGIEFKVKRGYYWDGKKDHRIQEVIAALYAKRKMYKDQKNPLEQIFKALLNHSYGKSIQKPIETSISYVEESNLERFWWKNYYKIIEDVPISDDIRSIKLRKRIDKFFNNSLFGIHVLAMSKRIMNEVMCLAYDLKCRIYYQDTDSFMIEERDLDKLVNGYQSLYNRQLIGDELGQFHPDFKEIDGEIPVSIESVYLMKKMYAHKLATTDGKIAYHLRGKGLTQQSIIHNCINDKGVYDPISFYASLFEDDKGSAVFDLTVGEKRFLMNKDLTVGTLNEFKRTITVTYPPGSREQYFD